MKRYLIALASACFCATAPALASPAIDTPARGVRTEDLNAIVGHYVKVAGDSGCDQELDFDVNQSVYGTPWYPDQRLPWLVASGHWGATVVPSSDTKWRGWLGQPGWSPVAGFPKDFFRQHVISYVNTEGTITSSVEFQRAETRDGVPKAEAHARRISLKRDGQLLHFYYTSTFDDNTPRVANCLYRDARAVVDSRDLKTVAASSVASSSRGEPVSGAAQVR